MKIHLKHVRCFVAKGKVYCYHRPTKTRIKADYGTPAFIDEVNGLNRALEEAANEPAKGTLGDLMRAYRASIQFEAKADATKKDYHDVMDWLKKGDDMPLAVLDAPAIMDLRDKAYRKHRRRFANYVVQFLSLLFNWGIPYGYTKTNPAQNIPRIAKPRGQPDANRPWSPDEFETVMQAMPPHLMLAVALGAYAGLREGDVVKLPWSAYKNGLIESRQRKTGDPVWVPAHYELRAILDHTKQEGVTIVMGRRGSMTESGFRASFFKIIGELTAAGKVRPGLTFHGLRHTAATMLADAGCDDRDIMAVTGHKTVEMVRKYTRKADQKRRAEAAIIKMEEYTRQREAAQRNKR